jgi:hypothetical protein
VFFPSIWIYDGGFLFHFSFHFWWRTAGAAAVAALLEFEVLCTGCPSRMEITCLSLATPALGGTGTSGALPTVPRACGDFRGASSSLDGLRESSLGGASTIL